MIMRRPTGHLAHVLAGSAVALLLSACGQGSTTTAPVESASSAVASGAIASADLCPEGPPARGSLTNFGGDGEREDGVVGTVTNNTGAAIWISNDTATSQKGGGTRRARLRTPCLLEAGKSVVYSGNRGADIYVSETPEDRTGTHISLRDPDLGYPYASVTGFKEPYVYVEDNSSCGADYGANETYLSEGESRYFHANNGAGYTGRVTVTRLPDDEKAANEYTGWDVYTDDYARMDVTISSLGYCS